MTYSKLESIVYIKSFYFLLSSLIVSSKPGASMFHCLLKHLLEKSNFPIDAVLAKYKDDEFKNHYAINND